MVIALVLSAICKETRDWLSPRCSCLSLSSLFLFPSLSPSISSPSSARVSTFSWGRCYLSTTDTIFFFFFLRRVGKLDQREETVLPVFRVFPWLWSTGMIFWFLFFQRERWKVWWTMEWWFESGNWIWVNEFLEFFLGGLEYLMNRE